MVPLMPEMDFIRVMVFILPGKYNGNFNNLLNLYFYLPKTAVELNFLAHIYLSFDNDRLAIGNFIADSVRGKAYQSYPDDIRKGILLHRQIDTFTDSHPIPRISSRRLHSNYGHYSRVIIDIYYDHFLAKNWSDYSDEPLADFTEKFYALLEDHFELLPGRVQHMVPYMVSDNWLLNYSRMEGIEKVLQGMNRRTRNKSRMDRAIRDLERHYTKFESSTKLLT